LARGEANSQPQSRAPFPLHHTQKRQTQHHLRAEGGGKAQYPQQGGILAPVLQAMLLWGGTCVPGTLSKESIEKPIKEQIT
jgi:hypothetical protein